MQEKDIRWLQRLDNYKKALDNLLDAVDLAAERSLSKLEKQGLIQSFEFTYELCWSTLKDFYQLQGETSIQGSRDAFRMAFSRGLIEDGDIFMEMIASRQLTSHTYNEQTADDIFQDIVNKYAPAFKQLFDKLCQIKER